MYLYAIQGCLRASLFALLQFRITGLYTIPLYNQTFYTREELIEDIRMEVDPVGLTTVLGAYEMAQHVHEYQMRNDATPYFWHISRVAKIIIRELKYFNSDVIAAAYLHDVLE